MTDPQSEKVRLRRDLRTKRARVSPDRRANEAVALTRALTAWESGELVCAYVPCGNEPGTLGMLDALMQAGARVRVPVIDARGGSILPLRWADYHGKTDLVRGPFGIPVPVTPTHPAEALAEAGTVLVPALAVDRTGIRLGRGAGYYDRSLGYADPASRLMAVVRDEELVEQLPVEPHDIPMGWVLTPGHGVMALNDTRDGK